MKKLIVLCSFMFVADLSAGKWESRKQIASGLSKVAYEKSRQADNAQNFSKVYSKANDERIQRAVIREENQAPRAIVEWAAAEVAKLKIASQSQQTK